MMFRVRRIASIGFCGAVLLSAGVVLAQNALPNQAKQTFPISLGTSGGNVHDITKRFCCSGTLGALVTKNGVNYILSNNHVLDDSDTAHVGDDISQPGLVDVGCNAANANVVAHFSEAPPLGTGNVDQRSCGQGKKFTIPYFNQVLVNSSSFSAGG